MRFLVIRALLLRIFRGTFFDKGRVSELLVFPLSFLVIWGLLFRSGIIPNEHARSLLVINLIWTISSVFQGQMNLPLMFDLWSREFAEICREGVTWIEFAFSYALFGTLLGAINLTIFSASLFYFFNADPPALLLLIKPLPIYYLISIGLGLVIAGAILRFGRTYGFLSWTGMQFIIMCSSPYAPLSSLPTPVRILSYLSPYTLLFEYVRSQDSWLLLVTALEGLALFIVGALYCKTGYSYARRRGGLSTV